MKKFDPFKNLRLDAEEQQIEKDIEAGLYQPVKNMEKRIEELQQIAKNTSLKNKTISLRINYKDLIDFKANAAHEGMPYQTLIGSLIHKYNTGQIIFRDRGAEKYEAEEKQK
ncbi:hypothetical protein KJ707_00925 [Patescibacteria group bacterium]|nr:hypothetical protein [Patescibacteria group bacterium]MBU1967504.1 hypothetical protein [Patescibacteria group bacterium]MBU2543116.1 hypothetical protein [Patescibacteria group bacterium]